MEPSDWPASDMERAGELLWNFGSLLGSGNGQNPVAEFPFQGDPAPAMVGGEMSLQLSTEPKHPVFGRGLSVRLTLPLTNPETSQALELTSKEVRNASLQTAYGHLGPEAGQLHHLCGVLSNIFAGPGLTENIAVQMAGRPRWAAQLWANDSRIG